LLLNDQLNSCIWIYTLENFTIKIIVWILIFHFLELFAIYFASFCFIPSIFFKWLIKISTIFPTMGLNILCKSLFCFSSLTICF
jgi:hypothetical protein